MKEIQIILLFVLVIGVHSLNNGLASVPPMGWSSWNLFWCNTDCDQQPNLCVSEKNIKEIADSLISSGLSDLGYKFVNIDDCYLNRNRDNVTGELIPNPKNFPNGMKSLGDYIHSKGLKYGMYEDVGSLTCGGYPGSMNQYALDVQTFKKWGVDYLKMDGCYATSNDYKSDYTTISNEITKQNANIIFECSWPAYIMQADNFDWYYLSQICHTWRTYGNDIRDNWGSIKEIIQYWATQDIAKYVGPGSYNMADFLTTGQGGMTKEEYRTQYTLWSMWASPIILSTDVRNLTSDIIEIIANKEVIQQVSQDPLAKQAIKVKTLNGSVDIWVKELYLPHSYAVAIVNMDDKQSLSAELNFSQILNNVQFNQNFNVRDLWQQKDLNQQTLSFTSNLLSPHSSQLIKIDISNKVSRKNVEKNDIIEDLQEFGKQEVIIKFTNQTFDSKLYKNIQSNSIIKNFLQTEQ